MIKLKCLNFGMQVSSKVCFPALQQRRIKATVVFVTQPASSWSALWQLQKMAKWCSFCAFEWKHIPHNKNQLNASFSTSIPDKAYLQYTHSVRLPHNVLNLLVVTVSDFGWNSEHFKRIAIVDIFHSTFEHLCCPPQSLLAVAGKCYFLLMSSVAGCLWCLFSKCVFASTDYEE